LIRKFADFAGVVDVMLSQYPFGHEWADAIEGFEGGFDELRIKKGLGEEERLRELALTVPKGRFDNTILDYSDAIATEMILIANSKD
jgi:hypothetical protein